MQILYKGLTEEDLQKVKHCSSAKDIWNTLHLLYVSNPSHEAKSAGSSFDTPCFISNMDEQMVDEKEEASDAEESELQLLTEESDSEVSDSEPTYSELQSLYDQMHTELIKLAKETVGLRKENQKLKENVLSISIPQVSDSCVLANPLTCSENYLNCESLLKEKEKFSKGSEISKSVLKEQKGLENKADHHIDDMTSHTDYHPIVCHYCGRTGHISHTCNIRRNINVRNKFVWIPKGQVRSSANHVGPKYKWVPKHPSSALLVQERSRVPLVPKKRTRGDVTAATTWSNHRKQCATIRNKSSVSRMSYHRVPLNYPEKNKRERIPRSTWRKPMNSVSQKKMLQTKDKYRRSPWVSKGSLRVEACDSKISYANVRWTY